LAVNSEKVKDYSLEFGALIQNGFIQSSLNLGGGGLSLKRDSLSLIGEEGTNSSGSVMSSIIKYFISNSNGEILSQPKIVTLPNVPARIKDTKFYPYIKPKELTGSSGNSISYDIENVEEGIDLTVLPTVLSDNTIVISLGLSLNQYLGDKIINAGIVGSFNLPQQSPKKLNTTFRIKPGDLIVLGGIKTSDKHSSLGSEMLIQTKDNKNQKSTDFVIVGMPRLIKFVEEKDRKKEERIIKKEKLRSKKK